MEIKQKSFKLLFNNRKNMKIFNFNHCLIYKVQINKKSYNKIYHKIYHKIKDKLIINSNKKVNKINKNKIVVILINYVHNQIMLIFF